MLQEDVGENDELSHDRDEGDVVVLAGFAESAFVVKALVKFRYRSLPRRDKGSIRAYLDTGGLRDRRGAQAHAFRRRYTKADIRLLA